MDTCLLSHSWQAAKETALLLAIPNLPVPMTATDIKTAFKSQVEIQWQHCLGIPAASYQQMLNIKQKSCLHCYDITGEKMLSFAS